MTTTRNAAVRARASAVLPDGVARGARATVLASTTLAVAAAAHSAAGGHVPTGAGPLLLGILTVVLCVLMSRTRARVRVLVPFLGALQVLLHHGFVLVAAPSSFPGASSGTVTGTSGAAASVGHGTGHAAVPDLSGIAATSADQAAHAVHAAAATPGMLALHAAAVVMTAVLLGAAERAARLAVALWTWLLPLLRGRALPVPGGSRTPVPDTDAVGWPLHRAGRSVAPRRGPPVPYLAPA